VPLYRLFTMDGADNGEIILSGYNWRPGDVIHRGRGDQLRVVDVVETDPRTGHPFDESSDYVAFLFVEPA
jgi:hypothetical protein